MLIFVNALYFFLLFPPFIFFYQTDNLKLFNCKIAFLKLLNLYNYVAEKYDIEKELGKNPEELTENIPLGNSSGSSAWEGVHI